MRGVLALSVLSSVLVVSAAQAADLPVKAPVYKAPVVVARTWTGFYIGGNVGYGWSDRTVGYTANDPASTPPIIGTAGFVGETPFATHKFSPDGVVGGLQLGYNWQFEHRWVAGLEADFNGSGIKGSGTGTSFLQNIPGAVFTNNTLSSDKLDWFGTVRARLGFLATDDLLLYGTGGFAYGRVKQSDSFTVTGPAAGPILAVALGGFSFLCNANQTCFAGATSRNETGWTAGGGAEWRFLPNWSLKAEYLYLNLGSHSVNSVAGLIAIPATAPASYRASFGTSDYHTVRLGLNWHF
jgi:outer membrane immunogenic protein